MRRICDANGNQLVEGMLVHLKKGEHKIFEVRYIHRNGIVHILPEDGKKIGMKVDSKEIVIGK